MKKPLSRRTVTLAVVFSIILLLVSTIVFYKMNLTAVDSKSNEVYFEIKDGDNLDSITARLKEKEYIKNADMAKIAGRLNRNTSFNVGTYKINTSWDSEEILDYLTNPENISSSEIALTFREGIWAKDIAQIVGENTNVKSEDLIKLWNDEKFLKKCIEKYDFLTDEILNSHYRVKLEGYLYPETYFFNKKTTAEEITYTLLDQFDKEYQKIKDKIKKSGYTVHELITYSSVVQYEAASKKDMKMIAGVFKNRLDDNMKLQSSVTVCYAIYDYDSWESCEQQTDIDSLYNTYEHEGLPVGPILNPGKDAIEATLNPTKSDYLYFVADVHGDGKVYYSKTLEEHNEKVKKYLGY